MNTYKYQKIGDTTFRFLKIPSIPARVVMNSMQKELDCLRPFIQIETPQGWLSLDDDSVVKKYVDNWEDLTNAEVEAYDYNFGFLTTWKSQRIPHKMTKVKYVVAESANMDPATAALINHGMATYEQLRDKYSLEEAFKLLDVLTVKKLNEFRASEANT